MDCRHIRQEHGVWMLRLQSWGRAAMRLDGFRVVYGGGCWGSLR